MSRNKKAVIAQLVEHILGKDEVISSTLINSSIKDGIAKPFVSISQTALFYHEPCFFSKQKPRRSKPARFAVLIKN